MRVLRQRADIRDVRDVRCEVDDGVVCADVLGHRRTQHCRLDGLAAKEGQDCLAWREVSHGVLTKCR